MSVSRGLHTPGTALERSSSAPAAGHETDESEILGTMGSAGSAGTGTCRMGTCQDGTSRPPSAASP